MHTISSFWILYADGLICLSPTWRDRPDPPLTEDAEPWPDAGELAQWLTLTEHERADVVAGYTGGMRPPLRADSSDGARRRRAPALAMD